MVPYIKAHLKHPVSANRRESEREKVLIWNTKRGQKESTQWLHQERMVKVATSIPEIEVDEIDDWLR